MRPREVPGLPVINVVNVRNVARPKGILWEISS